MISFDDFKKLDLRVATIKDVKEHPNADKLFLIQLEVGSETKQVVAGIRAFYSPGELIGKKVVIVNNLETATIRGQESQGMILAAKDLAGNLTVLAPEKDIASGSHIS